MANAQKKPRMSLPVDVDWKWPTDDRTCEALAALHNDKTGVTRGCILALLELSQAGLDWDTALSRLSEEHVATLDVALRAATVPEDCHRTLVLKVVVYDINERVLRMLTSRKPA
jgi:hypothetical protein